MRSFLSIAFVALIGQAMAVSTYAPISQIGDGQVQAPTGVPPPPPVSTTYIKTTAVSPPPPYPTPASNATVTVSKSVGNTLTQSVVAVTSSKPASSPSKPPAVQSTGGASSLVLNGGAGLSFAALVAYILA